MKRHLLPALPIVLFCFCAPAGRGLTERSPYRLDPERNLIAGIPARNPDGTINAVIEIPAGTREKWEVVESGTYIEWEKLNGGRRVIDYLGYPGNYGLIPRTRSGDGDALDVIVLGSPLTRGAVTPVRVIGVLMMIDSGEQDDKIVALARDGAFPQVRTLADLEKRYPGVTSILATWFRHYKGEDGVEVSGFEGRERALEIIDRSITAYRGAAEP